MRKPTKTQFYVMAFIFMAVIMTLWGFLWDVKFPGDYMSERYGELVLRFSAVHIIFNFMFVLLWIAGVIWLVVGTDDSVPHFQKFYRDNWNRHDQKDNEAAPTIKVKKPLLWIIGIVLFISLFILGKNIINGSVSLYNTSKKYQNEYVKRVQEKQGFYDKLWKTYLQKEKITNINKETFIEVTKVIMENRRDGEQITWKWLQENQKIPYEEFTRFYADLSDFIASQREGYFNIEKVCQEIANRNNTMLDTFPNNIYNRFLKCDRINFEYGFLSDSTKTIFETKTENIK